MAKVKKKLKKLKSSALSRIKKLSRGQMSLHAKMFILLGVFALVLGIVNILNMVVGGQLIFKDYFAIQLERVTKGIQADIMVGANTLDDFMAKIPTNHTAELDSLRRGKYEPIEILADEVAAAGSFYGYVLTDPEGSVINCTQRLSSLQGGQKVSKLMAELKDGCYSGYAEVGSLGVCSVVTRTFYGYDGVTPVATLTFVLSHLNDPAFLDGLKERYQVDLGIVANSVFTQTTIRDEAGKKRLSGIKVEDRAVSDSIYVSHVPFVGSSTVAGRDFSVIYSPIESNDGTLCATLFTGIEYSHAQVLMGYLGIAMFGGGTFFSLFVVFFCYRYVRRHITNPISDVAEAARRVAEKDLTQEVKVYNTGDEIDVLAASVLDMQDSLRDTIEEVQDAVAALRSQSQEISRASLAISDGANNQASSLEEIASSVEEMTSIIHQNTENSKKTSKLMVDSDAAISHIADISTDSMAASKKIALAIRNINALVSQTNILSLNASVEAARAGSRGRGFAVVAREVGRLAEQTKGTAVSVSETAEASIHAAEEVDSKLDEVTPQLHEVVDLMREITVSSVEQGQGAEHINAAIADLNQTTQRNAAGAEELAASAEELAASADILNNVVSQFKVKMPENNESTEPNDGQEAENA